MAQRNAVRLERGTHDVTRKHKVIGQIKAICSSAVISIIRKRPIIAQLNLGPLLVHHIRYGNTIIINGHGYTGNDIISDLC
ncbi:hypothetical protein D3C73_1540230 [compost metagenome]